MNLHPRHNRHTIRLLKEARLCFIGSGPGGSAGAFETGAFNTASAVMDWANRLLLRPGTDIAQGTLRALRTAFTDNPTAEDQRLLRNTVEFLRTGMNRQTPERVRRLVNEEIRSASLNKDQIIALTNPAEWFDALQAISYGGAGEVDPAAGAAHSPLAIVLRLSVQDRKDLFSSYIDTFFNADARSAIPEIGTAAGAGRFDTSFGTAASRLRLLSAMRAMIGIGPGVAAGTAEHRIATTGLYDRYFDLGTRRGALRDDYQFAIHQNPGRLRADQLQGVTSTGFFRGALALNVVRQEDLVSMLNEGGPLTKLAQEQAAVKTRTAAELDHYFGATRAQVEAQVRNVDRIPNWLFWVIGGLGFANRSTRGMTSFAAAIFGFMYLSGNQRPHRDALNFLGTLTGMGAGPMRDIARSMGVPGVPVETMTREQLARRANANSIFIARYARGSQNASTGLGALGPMSIADIMHGYTPGTAAGGGTFNARNPEFVLRAQNALPQGRGIRRNGIIRAFEDDRRDEAAGTTIGERNTAEVRVLLENICFLVLKEKGSADQMRRAQLVDDAFAELPEDRRVYQQISNTERVDPETGRTYKPLDLFRALVAEGHELAQVHQEKLNDFIDRHLGEATSAQRSEREIAETREKDLRERATKRKAAIEALDLGGYRLSVAISPTTTDTTVSLSRGGVLRAPLTVRLEDLAADRTPEQFARVWLERATAARRTEMENAANFPGAYTLGSFRLALTAGSTVRYGIGAGPISAAGPLANTTAESDAYLFLWTERDEIYTKYQTWHNGLAPGVAPGDRNALT